MSRRQNIDFLKKALTGRIDERLVKPETLSIGRIFLESPGYDLITVLGSDGTFTRQEVNEMREKDKGRNWITFK